MTAQQTLVELMNPSFSQVPGATGPVFSAFLSTQIVAFFEVLKSGGGIYAVLPSFAISGFFFGNLSNGLRILLKRFWFNCFAIFFLFFSLMEILSGMPVIYTFLVKVLCPCRKAMVCPKSGYFYMNLRVLF